MHSLAVLWNREFTDMLQQGSASQLSVDTVRASAGSAEAVRVPGYSAAEVRYVLISGHYRAPLNFTFHSLDSARQARAYLDLFAALAATPPAR